MPSHGLKCLRKSFTWNSEKEMEKNKWGLSSHVFSASSDCHWGTWSNIWINTGSKNTDLCMHLVSVCLDRLQITQWKQVLIPVLTVCWVPVWPWRGFQQDIPPVGPLRPCRHLWPQHQDAVSFRGCCRHADTCGTRRRVLEASNLPELLQLHHLQSVSFISCMPSGRRCSSKKKALTEDSQRKKWINECDCFYCKFSWDEIRCWDIILQISFYISTFNLYRFLFVETCLHPRAAALVKGRNQSRRLTSHVLSCLSKQIKGVRALKDGGGCFYVLPQAAVVPIGLEEWVMGLKLSACSQMEGTLCRTSKCSVI